MKRRNHGDINEKRRSAIDAINTWTKKVHTSAVVGRSSYVSGAEGALSVSLANIDARFSEDTAPYLDERLVPSLNASGSHAGGAMIPHFVQVVSAAFTSVSKHFNRKAQSSEDGDSEGRTFELKSSFERDSREPSSGVRSRTRSKSGAVGRP